MDILSALENALLNPNLTKRSEAEYQLKQAEDNHFVEFISLLTEALSNENAKTEVRMLAGIGLKNQLVSKDPKKKKFQIYRWINLDFVTKNKIKQDVLRCLLSNDERVAGAAAQAIAAIADIDFQRNEWPDLISTIIENTRSEKPDHIKKASLTCIGYICESADPNNPMIIAQSNNILIAILQGIQGDKTSKSVKLTALNSLINSLEFIKNNFEREGERNFIMQVVCEITQSDDPMIQASAFGCLAKIMSLYYKHMSFYMGKALYGLTISGMQNNNEKVACMAVEFWSTVCEEELDINLQKDEYGLDPVQDFQKNDLENYNFAMIAIQDVLPNLLILLTKQNEDPDDDDWSVAMAAGACLQLFAQNTGNCIVEPVLHFVEQNIVNKDDWRCREAAVMAFGSILDGPDRDQLKSLISQALDSILSLINDNVLQVKETVAWCLGRISSLIVDAIDINLDLPKLIKALANGLQDHPKISTNCCWTLINLIEQLSSDDALIETSIISKYYYSIVPVLIAISNRLDNEYNARTSAFETLSTFVTYSANDTLALVKEIATEMLVRLDSTFSLKSQTSSNEGKKNLEELQSSILTLLTSIIRKLGSDVSQASDNLMKIFLKLLESDSENSLIEECTFIAISAIAGSIGDKFTKYMNAFLTYLVKVLQEPDSPTMKTAIGLVADLYHSLGPHILSYLDGIMNILSSNLNNSEIKKEIRPCILSCFGDISASIGNSFQPYLDFVMKICLQASNVNLDDSSIETIDYILSIKESILDCYVGIVGGMSSSPDDLYQYVGLIIQFLEKISTDTSMCLIDSIAKSITGILGDIGAIYPHGEFKHIYMQPWVTEFIKYVKTNQVFDEKTKAVARWAKIQQKKQISL